jgi:putative FmdB family regulatory protein
MPIYEYACQKCGHTLDALQKVSDAPLRKCPECGALRLKRLVSAPQFRLKGSGWYETDFKSDKDKKKRLADAPDGAADASGDTQGENKSDNKGDTKDDSKSMGDGADAKPADKAGAKADKSGGTRDKSASSSEAPAKPAKPAGKPAKGARATD